MDIPHHNYCRSYVRGALFLVIAATLSGCATRVAIAPDAQGLADENSSYIKLDKNPKSEIVGVYNMDGTQVVEEATFRKYKSIKLRPGKYQVKLKTERPGQVYALPSTTVNTKAGSTYLFSAQWILDGDAARALFKEVKTQQEIN